MSHDSLALQAIDSSQPVSSREHVSPTEELHPLLCEQLEQARDRLADDLGTRVAEHALAGGIEDLDRAVDRDRDNHVLDVIEDGLQMSGVGAGQPVAERAPISTSVAGRWRDLTAPRKSAL